MTTLTDRYVAATLTGVPETQRADVDRELRASIADAIDAQTDLGSDPELAERAVLADLGDPAHLAASYADRPLYLIGPANFLAWRRLLILLLSIIVPLTAAAAFIAHSLTSVGDAAWLPHAFAGAVSTAATAALHVAFWTTFVFAVLERTPASRRTAVGSWNVDMLPKIERTKAFNEMVGSIVFTVLFIAAFFWQQFAPIAVSERGAATVPLLAPDLWRFWIPLLLVVLATGIPLSVLVYRRGGWEYWTAGLKVLLDLAFAVPVVILASTGRLLNLGFFDALSWSEVATGEGLSLIGESSTTAPVGTIIAATAIVILVWDAVATGLKAHRRTSTRRAAAVA